VFESKKTIETWVECGDDYYYGKNGEKVDYEMAVHFYEKAMKKKHPRATYMMGLCYELGRYVENDLQYAETLYATAAQYGDPDAQKRLKSGEASAANREETRSKSPTPPKSVPKPGLMGGDTGEMPIITDDMLTTANSESTQNGAEWLNSFIENQRRDVEQRETAHIVGDDFVLAEYYWNLGNYATAIEHYKKAAETGRSEAQYQLGKIYYEGISVTRNPSEGIRWLKEAAKPRENIGINAAASEMLEDIAAVERAERSRQESKESEQNLEQGLDFLKSEEYPKAARCFLKAAESGNAKAMWELHELFYNTQAAYDLRNGLIDILGHTNRNGLQREGYKWLQKAVELGEPNAVAYNKEIQKGLTPEAKASRERTHAAHMKLADQQRQEREAAEQRRRQRAQISSGSEPRDDWSAKQNAENAEATRRAQKSREEAARLAQRSKEWYENH
jgi:TPR repeat protein